LEKLNPDHRGLGKKLKLIVFNQIYFLLTLFYCIIFITVMIS
jgi:hypothetical protein